MSNARPASSLTMDASWLLIARIASFVLSLALPLFLVRHLPQTDFGLYKQSFLVVSSAIAILPLGFGMSALYFLPREPDKQAPAVLNLLLFNFAVGALACVVFTAWPSVVEMIFRSPQLVPYAPALGLLMLFWTTASAFDIVAVARGDMKGAGAIIIFIQVTRTAFVLAAGIFYGSIRALVWAAILQGVCQTIGFLIYLEARFPGFWRHFDLPLLRRQLSYAMPLGAAGLLYTLHLDLHNYVVSHHFGPTIFALYAIGTVQLPLVGMMQEAANSVLIPRISLLQHRQENREILLLTARAMRKLAAAYLPIYAVLLVVGREFIRFLFTDQYLNSWPIFAVNLTLLPISIIILDPLFRAYAEQRYFLIRVRAALLVALMVMLWFAVSWFGLLGAISVVVAVNLAERVITGIRFARVLGVTRKDAFLVKDIGKFAIAASVAALVSAIVRLQILSAKPIIILMACGASFALIYGALIFILGIPSIEEKKMVQDRLRAVLPAAWWVGRTES